MLILLTYISVIAIWATTPLAIKLGSVDIPPVASLTLRTLLAFSVGYVLLLIFTRSGLNMKSYWKLNAAASISLFPNMWLVYESAQYLSSGLLSLLFGLTPLVQALFASWLLPDSPLTLRKISAILCALVGLAFIVMDDAQISGDGYIGLGLMLLANLTFSLSAILVKRLNSEQVASPFQQSVGSMGLALPGMCLIWMIKGDVQWPDFTPVAAFSLLYLTIFASLVGFAAYYSLLKAMKAESVSLIALITPIVAIVLGATFADEMITGKMLLGAVLILTGLAIHQNLLQRLRRKPVL